MTFRLSRRRFLTTATATGIGLAGNMAMPYLSRAADRPLIGHGVQSGDVGIDSGVIWSRADRPSQMLVEVSTTESFRNARALPPIAALPETDFTAKLLVDNLPSDCTKTVVRPDPDTAIAQNQTTLTDAFFNDPTGTDMSKIFATKLELNCKG